MTKKQMGRPRIGKHPRQFLNTSIDVYTLQTLRQLADNRRSIGQTIDEITQFALERGFK